MTHPFHPLRDHKYELVTYRQNWGEYRVYYINKDGGLDSIPAQWTDFNPVDPFVAVSNGRAALRTKELLELCSFLRDLGK
ncbi:MAG: hypothetical protein KGS72_28175 [Cyanobacteria bacterium REEB67]|nr:hypothetical protein [Cyanobacteria bacterium REEB67]